MTRPKLTKRQRDLAQSLCAKPGRFLLWREFARGYLVFEKRTDEGAVIADGPFSVRTVVALERARLIIFDGTEGRPTMHAVTHYGWVGQA